MGVLHMAIPTAGYFPRQTRASGHAAVSRITVTDSRITRADGRNPQLDVRPATRESQLGEAAALKDAGRQTPLSGTLLPSVDINPHIVPGTTVRPRHEATLQRTPEQEAAQEALGKLVRQCLAGDQHAWQQLVVSQHRRIYAICYRFTGSPTDAEDLTQDVFLKLYRNLASFDTQKGSFQTWITTLARNLLVDHFRRTRLDRASDSLDASLSGEEDGATLGDRLADTRPSQEAHASGLELKAKIQQALAQLSPELREAVVLRDLEDMDYKEIAQVLRIPEGTVKSRISRGRGELARLLQRIEGQVV
jgi:RNA polymerase sigma-70 factor, ECF subfamily